MKHQQVVVDYTVMIKSCFTCLMLAFSGYVLIRLVCTIFLLPKWLQKQRELEELERENEAMAMKTKKFVQFLSTEKEDENLRNNEEEDVQGLSNDESNDDENSANTEDKKDK